MDHGIISNMERKLRLVDDVIEPAPTLEHRIKNLEAYIGTLKEEMAGVRKEVDALSFDILSISDKIFD